MGETCALDAKANLPKQLQIYSFRSTQGSAAGSSSSSSSSAGAT
jgi:hypothetical protein